MDSWSWAPVPGKYPYYALLHLFTYLNGFKRADPLVIDAKNDPTLTKRARSRVFLRFHHVCVSVEALCLVVKGKFNKKSALCCDFVAFLVVYKYQSKLSILLTGYL